MNTKNMNTVYFVVKNVENEWSPCLLDVGVLHSSLSGLNKPHFSLHADTRLEAQNYISRRRYGGDPTEYKIIEGKLKYDYDFSNIDILNSKQRT